jgi:hypothetical protein
MVNESAFGALSQLSAASLGVFRGRDAIALGVSRNQISTLRSAGVVDRVLPDTYRMTAGAPTSEQSLRAALLWAGPGAAAAGRSAGALYRLEAVCAPLPEIVVFPPTRARADGVVVQRSRDRGPLLLRRRDGLLVTGVEPTLVALGATLDDEAFEIACEDARRRRLTSVPALRAYLARHATAGRPGIGALRRLLDQLDPVHAARSALEVRTRRLLVQNGFTGFVREFRLDWWAADTSSTSRSSPNARYWRPTAGVGTTTPATTSTTTRNGAFPDDTAIASCSRPGRRSRATRRSCCPSWPQRSRRSDGQYGASANRASTNVSTPLIAVYRISEYAVTSTVADQSRL